MPLIEQRQLFESDCQVLVQEGGVWLILTILPTMTATFRKVSSAARVLAASTVLIERVPTIRQHPTGERA
jgi:hypothetical protein